MHYRTPDVALECLRRIRLATEGAQIVLVDTAPDDLFRARLAAEFPEVQFLPAPNHSYSRSVNLGLARLNTDYLTLMNADVYVQPDTFEKLLEVMRANSSAGVVAPKAVTPSGSAQNMGLPYALNYARLGTAQRKVGAGSPVASVAVGWLSGCMQVIRPEAWRAAAGYDESFRFCNEDLDFCLRLRKLGYECRLASTPVVHLGGTSTPDHPAFFVEGRRGGMVVTARHHGAALTLVHKAFLWTEALLGCTFSADPERRGAHENLLEMLRSGDFSKSPFGDTLDQR